MARPPGWRRTLNEARRQILVAVDFYNRPGDRRSYPDFIVHGHLAWQNLLQADRMRRGEEIFYREPGLRGAFHRNPDGSKRTWELSRCLKFEFIDGDPVRSNIEFFIGLRNVVEHHFQDAVLAETVAEAHAYVINFETELSCRFGESETLATELKFPLFVQSLAPARYKEQRALRKTLPAGTSSFISEFRAGISSAVADDERFAYRLLLVPMKGPKTGADMALNFVRQEELTEEERKKLLSSQGSVIIAEKYRDAAHGDEMLPAKAAEAVQARIPFKFGANDFTRLRKAWQIGPARSGSKDQLAKSPGFCIYSPAFSQFLYRPELVDRMVEALSGAEQYERLLGKRPVLKAP
ncbi:DUF3644 domain-containing protein [Mycobacterium intracellulare]|uniref:DUF3644 domain-containing protein n=1 Tax=Mycobacterium intracellulare TaxID=1767 RepID=UPI000BAC212B|nr:DUF3644 domain-containing protein [Mycobacterium intracellulare]ASW98535.1 hypothetical protein CKJ58_00395 [Mycobacterium intracellulare subsp. chimaera]PBA60179.1 hypothetical protein CKJ56_26240 [Mycobacterium intracellulare subsp. chimaera]